MDGAEEENQPTASRPALNGPGQAPLRQPPWPARNVLDLPADSGFTDWEHWAWARILRGMPANMSEYPGRISGDAKESDFFEWISGKPDCSACDPKDISNWPKHRNLSEEFLRLVLFHEPYRSAPERSLVEIECALVAEAIDWQGRSTSGGVQFANCRLEGDLTLYRARVPGLLSLEGSYVVGALKADGLEVSFDLFCNNGFIAKKEIRLIGAQVGGVVDFSGASLEEDLSADSLYAKDGLFCIGGFTAEKEVRLVSAIIGRDAAFAGATLRGLLRADKMRVNGTLHLREMNQLSGANLVSIRVGQNLQFRESAISGTIDLTSARIDGELHLAKDLKKPGPHWSKNSRFILRNVTCDALAGDVDSFRLPRQGPNEPGAFIKMELAGLKYARIGGLGAQNGATISHATVKELKGWLEAGVSTSDFTPEPYQQLAAALFRDGHPVRARAILHAMRLYERKAEKWKNWPRKLWLLAQGCFIGFGYRNIYGVAWFLALALAAASFGLWKTGYRAFDFSWTGFDNFFRWFWFSIGNSTPLLTLDDAHKDFLARAFGAFGVDGKPSPADLNVGIASLFYVHKMLGFMILTYLAAGLSGLASRDKGKS